MGVAKDATESAGHEQQQQDNNSSIDVANNVTALLAATGDGHNSNGSSSRHSQDNNKSEVHLTTLFAPSRRASAAVIADGVYVREIYEQGWRAASTRRDAYAQVLLSPRANSGHSYVKSPLNILKLTSVTVISGKVVVEITQSPHNSR